MKSGTKRDAEVLLVRRRLRFHKLVWGSQGTGSGVLVGGADQGTMMMFDAARLLDGSNDIGRDPLISQSKKHTGPVKVPGHSTNTAKRPFGHSDS